MRTNAPHWRVRMTESDTVSSLGFVRDRFRVETLHVAADLSAVVASTKRGNHSQRMHQRPQHWRFEQRSLGKKTHRSLGRPANQHRIDQGVRVIGVQQDRSFVRNVLGSHNIDPWIIDPHQPANDPPQHRGLLLADVRLSPEVAAELVELSSRASSLIALPVTFRRNQIFRYCPIGEHGCIRSVVPPAVAGCEPVQARSTTHLVMTAHRIQI